MQVYDLIMLIVLGMSTIFGAIKGLAWQVASLASILVSYIVAYRYRFQVAEMIDAKPPWNMFLAMLILYVGTAFVIWVGFRLMAGFIDRIRLKDFDRHLGALFGFAKGLVFCLLITMFAMTLLGPKQQAAICQSRSGYYITAALDKGAGILPHEIHDIVGPYLDRLEDQLKHPQNRANETRMEGWPDIPGMPSPSFHGSSWNGTPVPPSTGGSGLPDGTMNFPADMRTEALRSLPAGNGLRSAGGMVPGGNPSVGVFPR